VVDVGRRQSAADKTERECDVNVDSRAIPLGARGPTGCFAIGDPQAPLPPRLPLARGPGLRLPAPNPEGISPLPRDIAFAEITAWDMPLGRIDQVIDGAFGFLLASDGNVYVVSIDRQVRVGEPAPTTHSLYDAAAGRAPPALVGTPVRNFTATEVPFPTRIGLGPLQGPRLETTRPPDPEAAPVATYMRFPDPSLVNPQRWALVWEDVLPGTNRATGLVRAPEGSLAGVLEDPGADFCRSGVLVRDVVLFAGCTRDTDCQPKGGVVCRQATPEETARDNEIVRRCSRHMTSRRRYEITRATPTRLALALKLDEVPRTALAPCTKNEDCRPSPSYAGFECRKVRERESPRCVKPCAPSGAAGDRACRPGYVCEDLPDSAMGPLCVEAPPLDPDCWPRVASYKIQAGASFVVTGSVMPRLATTRHEGGECVPDKSRHRLLANRIPLDAPRCANIDADAFQALGRPPEGPNPCLFLSLNGDDPAAPQDQPRVKALFENPQLRFVLTNLDQYAGDAASIRFEVGGGFVPAGAEFPDSIIITVPARIVVGPTKIPQSPLFTMTGTAAFPYLYVVDQGRALFTPGGRGQILRLNPRDSQGRLRFDSNGTTSRFHIQ
jgi:hypothetical protein